MQVDVLPYPEGGLPSVYDADPRARRPYENLYFGAGRLIRLYDVVRDVAGENLRPHNPTIWQLVRRRGRAALRHRRRATVVPRQTPFLPRR